MIDRNLTDCNVGARKGRNHRDNLFVLYGVINSVMKGEHEDMDLQVFYKLWLQETMICLSRSNK